MKKILFIGFALLSFLGNGQGLKEFSNYGIYSFNTYYGFRGSSGEVVFSKNAFLLPELYSDSGLVLSSERLKNLGIKEVSVEEEILLDLANVNIAAEEGVIKIVGLKKNKAFWNVLDVIRQNLRSKTIGSNSRMLEKELVGIMKVSMEVSEPTAWSEYVEDLYTAYKKKELSEKEFLLLSSPFLLQVYRLVNDVKIGELKGVTVDANFSHQMWSQIAFLIEVHPDPRVKKEYHVLIGLKNELQNAIKFKPSLGLEDYLASEGIEELSEVDLNFFRADETTKIEYTLVKTPLGATVRRPLPF
jgi:hypothetical protein